MQIRILHENKKYREAELSVVYEKGKRNVKYCLKMYFRYYEGWNENGQQ